MAKVTLISPLNYVSCWPNRVGSLMGFTQTQIKTGSPYQIRFHLEIWSINVIASRSFVIEWVLPSAKQVPPLQRGFILRLNDWPLRLSRTFCFWLNHHEDKLDPAPLSPIGVPFPHTRY